MRITSWEQNHVKKIEPAVDNLSDNEKERLQLIQKVQKMLSDGFSYADIATETRISTRTVARYRIGDPMNLCRLQRPSRHKLLDELKPRIIQLLQNGYHASGVYTQLVEEGYGVHKSTVRTYVRNLANSEGINICKNKKGPCPEKKQFLNQTAKVLIKKQQLQNFLWTGESLPIPDIYVLYEKYPLVWELKKCISEFRKIFYDKNMSLLYLFIERYRKSSISAISSFANGIERDIDAVENAVASDRSNGFVEGNNNRIKAIKRTMYGRCGLKLLSAKIILNHS